jgi:hypothetical protein
LAETHLAWIDHTGTDIKGITKFFGEQTSHHPPVSAIVVENIEEKLKFSSTAEFSTLFLQDHSNLCKVLHFMAIQSLPLQQERQ